MNNHYNSSKTVRMLAVAMLMGAVLVLASIWKKSAERSSYKEEARAVVQRFYSGIVNNKGGKSLKKRDIGYFEIQKENGPLRSFVITDVSLIADDVAIVYVVGTYKKHSTNQRCVVMETHGKPELFLISSDQ
jgi:hypothetical protein